MVGSMADRYRRWFEYERDSHAQVLAALALVPAAQRPTDAYRKALTLLAHICAARRLWLVRFGAGADVPADFAPRKVADFFPADVTLPDLEMYLAETQAVWARFLAELTDEGLARVFEYQSLDGPRFRNTVEDILTQLFGHSWYHRGQIAQLLRAIDVQPAATDFVFWAREPLADEHVADG
jgi:uncharacterized damage-inducible protein DinB